MKDLQSKLERLLEEAQDCDLISNLATDQDKRATFRRTAAQLREVAEQLKADIAARMSEADGGAASVC